MDSFQWYDFHCNRHCHECKRSRRKIKVQPHSFPKILKQEYVEAALVFLPQPSAWLLTQRATFVPDMCPAWDLVAAFCLTTPSGPLHNVVLTNPLKALGHLKNTQTLSQEIVPLINRQIPNKYKDNYTHNEQAGWQNWQSLPPHFQPRKSELSPERRLGQAKNMVIILISSEIETNISDFHLASKRGHVM